MTNYKLAFNLLLACIIAFVLLYGGLNKPKSIIHVLHEAENVAVPEYYRRIIGYDSAEVVFIRGKWKLNFCYPNELVRNKFKIYTP